MESVLRVPRADQCGVSFYCQVKVYGRGTGAWCKGVWALAALTPNCVSTYHHGLWKAEISLALSLYNGIWYCWMWSQRFKGLRETAPCNPAQGEALPEAQQMTECCQWRCIVESVESLSLCSETVAETQVMTWQGCGPGPAEDCVFGEWEAYKSHAVNEIL